MEHDAQIVVRVPLEMQDRLKAYADKLSKEYGITVTVAAGIRRLLSSGLEQAGYPEGSAAPSEVSKPLPKKAAKAKGKR